MRDWTFVRVPKEIRALLTRIQADVVRRGTGVLPPHYADVTPYTMSSHPSFARLVMTAVHLLAGYLALSDVERERMAAQFDVAWFAAGVRRPTTSDGVPDVRDVVASRARDPRSRGNGYVRLTRARLPVVEVVRPKKRGEDGG